MVHVLLRFLSRTSFPEKSSSAKPPTRLGEPFRLWRPGRSASRCNLRMSPQMKEAWKCDSTRVSINTLTLTLFLSHAHTEGRPCRLSNLLCHDLGAVSHYTETVRSLLMSIFGLSMKRAQSEPASCQSIPARDQSLPNSFPVCLTPCLSALSITGDPP